MKNKIMETQIGNMLLSATAFRQSLEVFALKDDGVITREEQKTIRQLTRASRRFEKALDRIRNNG